MLYARKIKCPMHYILKPGGIPYVMERIPSLKNISEANAKALKLQLWRPKKDRFGRKILNEKDYIQPEVSASEMKMRLWNPTHPMCQRCKACVTA
jgi:hypothetical protein